MKNVGYDELLDTVFPIERRYDWQIRIALFQSEKSFGDALIKGEELNDLPKGLDSINIHRKIRVTQGISRKLFPKSMILNEI